MSDEQDPDIWEKFDRLEKDVASLMLRVSQLEEIVMRKAVAAVPQPKKAIGTSAPTSMAEPTVNQLRAGDKNIIMQTRITTISDVAKGMTKGKEWKNVRVRVGDYTGQIDLILWNEDVDTYNHLMQNNYITITGVDVTEYNNKLQLGLSKAGKITLAKEEHIL